jgi:hypothetical protein
MAYSVAEDEIWITFILRDSVKWQAEGNPRLARIPLLEQDSYDYDVQCVQLHCTTAHQPRESVPTQVSV